MDEQKPEEVQSQVIGAPVPADKASGMALSAMITGIVGMVCSWAIGLNFALGLAALILGIIEYRKIKEGQSNEKGKGMALTGIILGSLILFGAVISVIIFSVTIANLSAWLPSIINDFGTFY